MCREFSTLVRKLRPSSKVIQRRASVLHTSDALARAWLEKANVGGVFCWCEAQQGLDTAPASGEREVGEVACLFI